MRMDSNASRADMEDNFVDPLMEQMRSVLRLGPRASDPSRRRLRRFSDADRPPGELPTRAEPVAIRSTDGTRWLPAPDEQSLRIRQRKRTPTVEDREAVLLRLLKNHSCNSAICAVTRVFETTELLELVLSFLETKDVLSLRLTNRQWDSTIHHSPQLRLHFFTFGQWARPGSQFQLLPLSLPGLSIELGRELHLGRWIDITFTPEAARRICPDPQPTRRIRSRSIFEGLRGGLGSRTQNSVGEWSASRATPTIHTTIRYEDLFVTQPPVLGVQAFIVYSPNPKDEQRPPKRETKSLNGHIGACAKLSCDAGITLGFLAETAQSLLRSQEAGPSNLRDARVMFRTIMSFCAPEQVPRKRTTGRTVTPL